VKLEQGCEGCQRRALLLHRLAELVAAIRHFDTTMVASPFRVFVRHPAELTLLSRAIGEDFGGARLGVLGLKMQTEDSVRYASVNWQVTNIGTEEYVRVW